MHHMINRTSIHYEESAYGWCGRTSWNQLISIYMYIIVSVVHGTWPRGACGFINLHPIHPPVHPCTLCMHAGICTCTCRFVAYQVGKVTHCMHFFFYYTVTASNKHMYIPVIVHGLSTWNSSTLYTTD